MRWVFLLCLMITPAYGYNLPSLDGMFIPMQHNPLQDVIGFEGENVDGAGQDPRLLEGRGDQLRNQASGVCGKKYCDTSETFSAESTLERETKMDLLGYARRDDGFYDGDKSFLDKAKYTLKHPEEVVDYITSKEESCEGKEEVLKSTTPLVCDQYEEKTTHHCTKTKEVKQKICQKTIKTSTCKGIETCHHPDQLTASGVGWNAHTLQFRVSQYREGWSCGSYAGTLQFFVDDLSKIQQFLLIGGRYDDHIRISVNDVQVANEPTKGTKLVQFSEMHVDIGHERPIHCEGGSTNHLGNYDLKPYLKQGVNTLKIEVVIGGVGLGEVDLRVSRSCCSKTEIEWEESCDYL